VILVTVGTNEARFDRLLEAVSTISSGERIVVQHGASGIRPAGAECVDFLPFDALVELVREARAVVTHAGVGSILVALSQGKRPLVVPRRKRFAEAVDDHQVSLAERLARAGLVTLVEDPASQLAEAVTLASSTLEQRARPTALVDELRAYLERACTPVPAARR
jgi:UDP-N-acetylglucosamine transferase subunit ALG13